MIYTPRDYQSAITGAILHHPRYNLWSGMGTGKTVATLTAIDILLALGEVSRVLVVAPLRVASSTWPDELAKWDHLTNIQMQVVVGTQAQRMAALAAHGNVHVINYENIPWLVEALGKNHWPFDMVVSDESTKLKSFRLNGGGSRVKALAKAANGKTVRWVNLTGTPASNGLIDLWGQQWFVDKGEALGRSFGMFRDRWFTKGYDGYSLSLTPYAEREITERMKPSSLTIDAKDYMDLPDLVPNNIGIVLTPKAMKQYKAMEQEMFIELDGEEVEAFNAASKTIKCLQMASGALYLEEGYSVIHDAKLDALEDVIEEANGEPVLVAYHFKSDLDRLKKRLKQAVVLDKDPETIRRWNRGEIPVLLAHPACLHPSTEVLTERRGWVRIVDVASSDRVFDGVDFVSHSGCVLSGVKPVTTVFGVTMTPDHKLLIGDTWVEAAGVRDTEDARREARYSYTGDDAYLSAMLTLPKRTSAAGAKCSESEPTREGSLPVVRDFGLPSNDGNALLVDMAACKESGYKPGRQGLHTVRGCWSWVLGVLDVIRKLYARHASDIRGRANLGASRQHQGLLQRELPLGHKRCPAREQNEQQGVGVSGYEDASGGTVPTVGGVQRGNYPEAKLGDDTGRGGRRLPAVKIPQRAEVSEVYDLVDCGPRHRFVVRNAAGEAFVSHNSAGHGLNLQDGGRILVFFSHWWSLEEYSQIIERIGPTRQLQAGHPRTVYVHHLVAKGTLDEVVIAARQGKVSVQQALMDYQKQKG